MKQSSCIKKLNSFLAKIAGEPISGVELLYFIGTAILIGLKAIGMEEMQWPFKVMMVVAFACILVKVIIEKHKLIEYVVMALLLVYGIWSIKTSNSYGLLILIFLFIGTKDINIKKLFRCLALEYAVCFVFTTILGLLGVREGVVLVHEKFGTELLRRSLGYTHPNVLHITYVILMALLIYALDFHGKKLYQLLIGLFFGDLAVFVFSLSFTGMIMSVALFLAVLYFEIFHFGKQRGLYKAEKVILNIWVPFTILGFILLARFLDIYSIIVGNYKLYTFFNRLFNERTWCINYYYSHVGCPIFGTDYVIDRVALDCSYGYALYRYGIVFIILILVAYLMTMRYLIKKERYYDIAIMVVFLFAGMSEPFMFNASIKNLTIFMVGECAYSLLKKDSNQC